MIRDIWPQPTELDRLLAMATLSGGVYAELRFFRLGDGIWMPQSSGHAMLLGAYNNNLSTARNTWMSPRDMEHFGDDPDWSAMRNGVCCGDY